MYKYAQDIRYNIFIFNIGTILLKTTGYCLYKYASTHRASENMLGCQSRLFSYKHLIAIASHRREYICQLAVSVRSKYALLNITRKVPTHISIIFKFDHMTRLIRMLQLPSPFDKKKTIEIGQSSEVTCNQIEH